MMRLRILMYVCMLVFSETHTAITKDSDEQSMLQEALLLVELLKAEYSRVLRENNIIKKSKIDEKDLQTCAPTDDAIHVPTDKAMRHIEQSRTSETLMPYTIQDSRRSYHPGYFPRRRFVNYRDYYGNYGPAKYWRRMDYDNIFGPQPNHTLLTTTAQSTVSVTNSQTDATLSSILNASPSTTTGQSTVSVTNSQTDVTLSSTLNASPVSDIPTSSILLDISSSSTVHLSTIASMTTPKPVTLSLTTSKPTELSIPTLSPSTAPPISSTTSSSTLSTTLLNKIQPTFSTSVSIAVNTLKNEKAQTQNLSVSEKVSSKFKKLHLSVDKTTVTSTNEPEQAQVAAELENELEAGIQSSSFSPFSRRGPVKWRASTRVHLAKSTPYYLPLPENHAFCYTNPRSSLCRTFIK